MARALRGPGRGHRFHGGHGGHDDGPTGHGDAEGRADAAGAVPRGVGAPATWDGTMERWDDGTGDLGEFCGWILVIIFWRLIDSMWILSRASILFVVFWVWILYMGYRI